MPTKTAFQVQTVSESWIDEQHNHHGKVFTVLSLPVVGQDLIVVDTEEGELVVRNLGRIRMVAQSGNSERSFSVELQRTERRPNVSYGSLRSSVRLAEGVRRPLQ